MDSRKFALLVKEMRDAQNKYFEYAKNGNINKLTQLGRSKKLEAQVDKEAQKIINAKPEQPDLFHN